MYTGAKRKLEWLTWKWRPDPQLHSLFQQIGLEKHGQELEEEWADEIENRSCPVRGEYFPVQYDFEESHMFTNDWKLFTRWL